jgi:NHL repeat
LCAAVTLFDKALPISPAAGRLLRARITARRGAAAVPAIPADMSFLDQAPAACEETKPMLAERGMPEEIAEVDINVGSPERKGTLVRLMTGLDHRAAYSTASKLNMRYGLAVQDDHRLFDAADWRPAGFDTGSPAAGAAATRLAGRHDFTRKGGNRWGLPVRDSLCRPYGVAACGDTLITADSGNNRVTVWEAAP